MSEEVAKLYFDDKEYIFNDLSDQAKYVVSQIQDLEQQARSTRARLDQIEVAKNGFNELLRQELEKPEENE